MVKDISSSLAPELALLAVIGSSTTTNGAAISTADYELGIQLNPIVVGYLDGTYEFQVEESDDVGFSSPSVIPDERIIGTAPTLSAVTAQGDAVVGFGVLTSKPYIRVNVVSTSVSTGATVAVVSNKKAEVAPAS